MTKRMLVAMVSLSIVLSMVGVTVAQQAPTPGQKMVQEMLAKAKAAVTVVSPADVKASLDQKEKAIYLDVRDPNEFSAGHLPGAINVSRGTLEFNIFGKIPDQNAKIYVYCKSGSRSTLATKTLIDLGYKNAVLMVAPFEDWIKAGYPVER